MICERHWWITWEGTNEHCTMPASPLKPRKQASANFTAAYALQLDFNITLSAWWKAFPRINNENIDEKNNNKKNQPLKE